jgi:RNA polymerase sigma-70 factor (ECF subfamily)
MTTPDRQDHRRWVLSVLERYERPLLRYAMRLLGEEAAARDAVQHTFLRLCDQTPEAVQGRVAPWLFTVCRNKAVDMLRKSRRTEPLSDDEATEPAADDLGPAEALEREELYRRLNELIDRLPAGQREAIDLWSEGFSYAQIAGITGASQGNVRVLVHRALKRLREHPLARQLGGERLPANRLPQTKPIDEIRS